MVRSLRVDRAIAPLNVAKRQSLHKIWRRVAENAPSAEKIAKTIVSADKIAVPDRLET
jgi:hypothetical protein